MKRRRWSLVAHGEEAEEAERAAWEALTPEEKEKALQETRQHLKDLLEAGDEWLRNYRGKDPWLLEQKRRLLAGEEPQDPMKGLYGEV